MKNRCVLTALAIVTIVAWTAACRTGQVGNKADSTNSKQTYRAVGVVTLVDANAGKITIDHEDIPGYMPAMQMDESVLDRALLGTIKAGDKVDFEIERTGSTIVFTKLTKIGAVAIVDGGAIYKARCAECHGPSGEGAKKGIPLVKGHALHHSEAEYIAQVNNGEGKKMPAFKDKLTPEQIAAVVKFVRTEIQREVRKDETHVHQH